MQEPGVGGVAVLVHPQENVVAVQSTSVPFCVLPMSEQ